jgi:hypothetical protein
MSNINMHEKQQYLSWASNAVILICMRNNNILVPVCIDCPLLIVPLVLSNAYLHVYQKHVKY